MAVVLAVYVLALVAVNVPPLRRAMASKAAAVLAEKLQTEVRIADLEIGALNRVVLHGVTVKDRAGESMLAGKLLSAKIAWLPLLHGEVSLRSISLLDTQLRLNRLRADTATNFQFVLDAFASKDITPSALNLQVNSLILRRCSVSYDRRDASPTPGRFNASHLHLGDVDANISLKRLTPDSLNLRIRSLKLREHSGLDVQSLTLRLAANKRGCRVSRFDLRLPESHIALPEVRLSYDFTDFRRFARTLNVTGSMEGARISTSDLACFLPQLRDVRRTFTLRSSFGVSPRQIRLSDFALSDTRGDFSLSADARLSSSDSLVTEAGGTIRSLEVRQSLWHDLFAGVLRRPVPDVLARAGDLSFAGYGSWKRGGEWQLAGTAGSGVGSLKADLAGRGMSVKGRVGVQDFCLATLLADKKLPDGISLMADGCVSFTDGRLSEVQGAVLLQQMTYLGNTFHDLKLSGKWLAGRLDAAVHSADDKLRLTAALSGNFDGRDFSQLQLEADVQHLAPALLGLGGKFARPVYAGKLFARLSELNARPESGELLLSQFRMSGPPSLAMDRLHVTASPSRRGTRVDLRSDFADLSFDGPLDPGAIKTCINNIVARCLPTFARHPLAPGGHEWAVRGEVRAPSFLNELFGLKLSLESPLRIEGNLRDDGGRMAAVVSTDGFDYDGFALHDVSVYLTGEGSHLGGMVRGQKRSDNGRLALEVATATEDGRLNTNLRWSGTAGLKMHGELQTTTTFSNGAEGRSLTTTLLPSELAIGDTVWNVMRGRVDYSDRALTITDVALGNARQSLAVDGRLSPNPDDSILATLHNVDIEYVLNLADFHAVDFAGQASGRMSVIMRRGAPLVKADIRVPDFLFNGGPMGNLHLIGGFDARDKRIDLDGHMANPDSGFTDVKGFVSLRDKGLDLHIASERTNLRFLRHYIADIFGDFEGRATGQVRLHGPFKQLDFDGEEVAEAEATVLATGVRYKLEGGRVVMSPGEFAFSDFTLRDGRHGTGTANGKLMHTHLKNLRYEFAADVNRLLVYDQIRSTEMPFYATAYGSGSLKLRGWPGSFEADVDMRPEAGTKFTYILDSPESFDDDGLVTFRDVTPRKIYDDVADDSLPSQSPEATGQTDIRLNMLLDVRPEAEVKIIMDDRSGDHILVHGSGPIRANFYNKGDFRMYGTYTIDDGMYKMSLQDVIRKDFALTKGGRISFGGDPYQGDLDLQAVYTVNSASLSDLNIGGNFSQSSVRVNCLLNFSGKVNSPQISFDIDLPTVNSEEKQMVRNIISTEEDMNMQVLYLLGIGRFYTYNNAQAGVEVDAAAQSSAAMKSFLSSTLSSQLNHIIQNAVGNSNWSFGANVSTGSVGTNDVEVEGLLSGRLLNNRLIVNGNIGYRDNTYYSSNFIGDFDVRYLLTPGGTVSLKAYSETNDRYFTKSALTTQGAGIMLQRDFSNLKELFKPRRSKKKANKRKK